MAEKLTKDDRRTAARQKAAEARAQRERSAKRKRIIIQSSILLGAVAIVAIIALVVVVSVNGSKNAAITAAGPKNMASGGITLISSTKAETTPASKSIKATPNDPKKVQIRVYEDYQCPYCHQFTTTNSSYLKSLLDAGKITYEIHPIAFLNEYSLRSASAAGCVANSDPDLYFAYNEALYENQPPEETGTGLTNAKLASLAQGVGVKDPAVLSCIKAGNTYASWFTGQTNYSQSKGAPNSDVKTVDSTPTIIIDNKKVTVDPTNPAAFQALVVAAAKAKGLTL